MNFPPTLRKLAGRGVTFSRALLKDGNLLSRPQPEVVLAPVSYRSSRRRRQGKRLLLKVPIFSEGLKVFSFPIMKFSLCFTVVKIIAIPATSFVNNFRLSRTIQAVLVWKDL